MTQEYILVSPLIPACPKPGATAPAFRPADQGDTTARAARIAQAATTEELCLALFSLPVGSFHLAFTFSSVSSISSIRSFTSFAPRIPTKSETRNPQIRNSDAHSDPIVPHFFALYRQTNFFFSAYSATSLREANVNFGATLSWRDRESNSVVCAFSLFPQVATSSRVCGIATSLPGELNQK